MFPVLIAKLERGDFKALSDPVIGQKKYEPKQIENQLSADLSLSAFRLLYSYLYTSKVVFV